MRLAVGLLFCYFILGETPQHEFIILSGMKKIFLKVSMLVYLFGAGITVFAQDVDKAVLNWYNTKTPGMNTEAAYKMVKKQTPKTVVVGVIDSGVDIEHEDLKGQIWVNEDEIPGNGIDDDKNGYIDDVHGWNFLGTSNNENLEYVRIYKNGKARFDGKTAEQISAADKADFALWEECRDKLKTESEEAKQELEGIQMLQEQLLPMLPMLVKSALGKESYTEKDLLKWKPKDDNAKQIRGLALMVETGQLSKENLDEGIKQYQDRLAYHLNPDFNGRTPVGDNPDDFSQVRYGNNDVEGADALHGTHVSGIIGAVRGNGIGGDGVAAPVKIMSLRAVPNGDEYDKDIALAIRYAVDNGASVINMSFGKSYSPHQKEVYDAMKYAEEKGVLLVHAAGNDAANLDKDPNFPAVRYAFQTEDFKNLLTIGASTRDAKGHLAASFSNYGGASVDVFAPGFEIYNTVPDNKYRELEGTSMAAPMVSGVAAFLKAYFPDLSMFEIRDIILKSATPMGTTQQELPGTEDKVLFSQMSRSGSIVNVQNAVKMAQAMSVNK